MTATPCSFCGELWEEPMLATTVAIGSFSLPYLTRTNASMDGNSNGWRGRTTALEVWQRKETPLTRLLEGHSESALPTEDMRRDAEWKANNDRINKRDAAHKWPRISRRQLGPHKNTDVHVCSCVRTVLNLSELFYTGLNLPKSLAFLSGALGNTLSKLIILNLFIHFSKFKWIILTMPQTAINTGSFAGWANYLMPQIPAKLFYSARSFTFQTGKWRFKPSVNQSVAQSNV